MRAADLKSDLIHKISSLKEMHIIEELSMLLDFEMEETVFELSESQNSRILQGRNEYQTSKILTNKVADAEIDQWLEEK
jgi:hypothetical protein